MRSFLSCLLTIATAAVMQANAASKYEFRQIDTGNGLPDNNVRNLVMLPDGLMCIQTSTILNLYDGTACSSYAYDPERVPYNEYNGLNRTCYDAGENLLWCMTRDNLWVFDLTTRHFDYDVDRRFERFGLPCRNIGYVYVDSRNDYWVVSADDNSLWHCRRSTGKAVQIDLPHNLSRPANIIESGHRLWLLALDGSLAEYNMEIGSFLSVHRIQLHDETQPSRMETAIDSHGNLWIMFDHNLVRYDTSTGLSTHVRALELSKQDIYTSIAVDRDDNLWVGSSHSGVCIVDGRTMQPSVFPYLRQTDGKRTLPHTDISKIYVDNRGGVWIATQAEGLLYWHKDMVRVQTIDNTTLRHGQMPDESVKCMVEDSDGTLLIGTIRGLLRYDPRTDAMSESHPELRNELCISLYRDSRNRIWLGTFNNGAFCIDGRSIRHYHRTDISTVDVSYHDATPNYNSVRTFYEDARGDFWISVYGGAGRFDPDSGEITLQRETHPELSRYMIIRDICDLGNGLLLMSGDNGRYIYDTATDRVNPDVEPCYSQNIQTLIDSRRWEWHATSAGIEIRDADQRPLRTITIAEGLLENNCMSLVSDDTGNVWASTFSGISRIRPYRDDDGRYAFSVTTYTAADGVTAGVFFQKSFLRHSSGDMYFGGAHGINRLSPDKTYQESGNNLPYISALRIGGRKIEVGEEFNGRVVLPVETGRMKRIDLKHDESFLTFEFSNLNCINPTHTSYRYRLVNFDAEWTEIHPDGVATVSYTYLRPGEYTFEVVAADNGTDWSTRPTRLQFTIHPPFYSTTAAFAVYALLVLLAVCVTSVSVVRRTRRRIRYRQTLERQRQLEQLDKIKYSFYTNISHELRTPLTLILLPLESLLRENADTPMRQNLETMYRNARHLLSLVNNLLDFRKLETDSEQLNLSRGNISRFTADVVDSFREAASRCNIEVQFESDTASPVIAFDPSQMSKILNNLLSNALKFTKIKGGGFLTVRISDRPADDCDNICIEISDTGIGIPERDMPHIFDRFFRSGNSGSETGSGIGLSIVKQYVEMHGGTISAESHEGEGTKFTIIIPADLETGETPDLETAADADTDTADICDADNQPSNGRKTIMVVDDNPDFREYLVAEMSSEYAVITAESGEACIEQLSTATPDVILCDITMPGLSGFEVTRRIKDDIATSHIPVILLTARTSDEARLEGYETGADSYFSKPFDMQTLRARIRNLIRERERRISDFTKRVNIEPSQISITTIDEKFMSRVFDSVERNIDHTDYTVEQLAADVGVHRMHLYRKLQYLTDTSPLDFIRTMRLKRAAQLLLKDRKLTIAEIADMVGFGTSEYFSKYFRKMFGCTPTQYRAENGELGIRN